MKGLALTATFLVLMAAVATAKSLPVKKMNPSEDLNAHLTRNDIDINSGPSGAMLEREYFQTSPPFKSRRPALPAAIGHFQQSAIGPTVSLMR